MDVKELTDLLVASSEDFYQMKFIPWWEEDYEKHTYKYKVMEKETMQDAQACLAECGKEELLTPAGKYGLTLFHLAVWHNFYDAVEEMLCDGRIEGAEVDVTDHKGHGLTPFLLACVRGNLAMVKLLLAHGADDSRCDDRGMNAYHFLVYPRLEELEYFSDALERSVEQRGEIARLLTCDINLKNAKGLTPLEHMLSTGHCDEYTWPLAEIFLEKGAATDYVDEDGNTLLMLARRNGHDTAALQLMKHCPELLNVANKKGVNPILHAIDFRDRAMYLALLDHGAEPVPDNDMEMFPLSQITHNALADVHSDNRDSLSLGLYMAEKMIRQADPDDDDDLGEVAQILHSALRLDEKTQVLDICKDAGLDFTMPIYYHGDVTCLRDECLSTGCAENAIKKLMDFGVDMERAVVEGRTPVNILASSRWHDEENEAFFTEMAKIFSKESMEQTNNRGEAAVHLAAENGHIGMLKVMIEKGVDVNLTEDAPAEAGITPLHIACIEGHADVVKLLMDAGADDTMKNLNGETPAHFAVMKKKIGQELDTKQRAALLKELKSLDIPREDGKTPLMLLGYRNTELLPIFLDKGIDVNRRDNNGRTVLMYHTDKDVVKVLLQAGADINAADNAGNTPLHHALMHGSQGEARYLIRKGADYNRPNNKGETPAQLAVEKGCETVLELMTDIK